MGLTEFMPFLFVLGILAVVGAPVCRPRPRAVPSSSSVPSFSQSATFRRRRRPGVPTPRATDAPKDEERQGEKPS